MAHYPGCSYEKSVIHPADCKECSYLMTVGITKPDFEFWEQNNNVSY